MLTTYKMTFSTSLDKNFTLSITRGQEALPPLPALTAANNILAANPFGPEVGNLIALVAMQRIEKTVTEYDVNAA